jgi:hypothetical protein
MDKGVIQVVERDESVYRPTPQEGYSEIKVYSAIPSWSIISTLGKMNQALKK